MSETYKDRQPMSFEEWKDTPEGVVTCKAIGRFETAYNAGVAQGLEAGFAARGKAYLQLEAKNAELRQELDKWVKWWEAGAPERKGK